MESPVRRAAAAACRRRRRRRSSTAASAPGSRPYLSRLPSGILARPEPAGHLLVDHDDRRRALREIAVLQQPAAEQRDAHRLEVAGHDLVFGQRRRGIVGPLRRLTLERDAVVRLTVDEEIADRADGERRRAARESAGCASVKNAAASAACRRCRAGRPAAAGRSRVESAVRRLHADEAADQQARRPHSSITASAISATTRP